MAPSFEDQFTSQVPVISTRIPGIYAFICVLTPCLARIRRDRGSFKRGSEGLYRHPKPLDPPNRRAAYVTPRRSPWSERIFEPPGR